MLGRLFKSKSSLSVGGDPASARVPPGESSEGTANPASASTSMPDTANPNTNVNSYEDSYTREILYGSSELPLHVLPFNPRRFRLVVSQDGGNLRSKQVLYDSANDIPVAPPSRSRSPLTTASMGSTSGETPLPNSRLPTAANTLKGKSSMNLSTAKQSYNINDINDYMFGRGLPSVERHISTKIHMLPALSSSANGVCSGVLLTKLFSISDSAPPTGESAISADSGWVPRATFPSRDTVLQVCVPTGKPGCNFPDQGNRFSFSSRFAVGVIIPLEDSHETVEEVVSSNWETLSHFLIVLQKLVCKKLTLALKTSLACNSSPYISNKRIQFPSGVLQQEAEFGHQLQKFIKLVYYNVNTPRLVNIHAFMTYSLNHVDSKFKTNVTNWALEVINWLEFKDGRNYAPFHAQAIPQMHSQNSYLSHSSSSATSWYRSIESPVTSNTFLASLFAAILPLRYSLAEGPLHVDSNSSSNQKVVTRIVVMTSNSSVAKKLIFILSGLIPDAEFLERLENEGKSISTSKPVAERATAHEADAGEPLSNIYENPPKSEQSGSVGGSAADSPHESGISFTAKPITAKPIPIRMNSSTSESHSEDSTSVSVSSTKGWDVPHKSATSLSLHGHKNPLESNNVTVAQQIPRRVSASNTSSMAYLSSSLNSSLSSSASNYSLSRLGSSFMDKWKNSLVGSNKLHQNFISETMEGALTSDTLNMRPAFITAKSPSPADELDEPIWEDSYSANSVGSPVRQKISRTQSLLNLFNEMPAKKAGLSTSTLGVDRTRTAIYIPPISNESGNADSANSKVIGEKVRKLMLNKLHMAAGEEKTLVVDAIDIGSSVKSAKASDDQSQQTTLSCGPLHRKAYLQQNVAFVDEFRPEYTVQSCPVNPRLEAQVSNAMKNDLLFYQNNCGYEKVTSKTVFVSLRAREIKLIEMSVGNQKRGYFGKGQVPPASPAAAGDQGHSYFSSTAPQSPGSSFFHGNEHATSPYDKRDSPGGNSFRTTVKKIYTPNRNAGDKESIQQVEGQLEKLNEVAALINSNSAETAETKDLYNRMLFNAVRELIT